MTLSSLIGIPLQSIKSQNYATARVLGCLGVCGKAVFEVSAGLKAACGLDTDVWLFDRISVVTSNLDAFGEERGFFFASARVHRWAAGPTDAWAALVDASGAMASAPVPV